MSRNLLDARARWRSAWPRVRAMLAAVIAFGAMSADGASVLTYRTSWIGNTYGGASGQNGERQWVQIAIEAIAAGPDGTVYTNTPWDESGGELGAWRNNRVTYGMQTHGWGNSGGDAVAINSRYLYASASIDNEGGGLVGRGDYPDKGRHWVGITRRKLANIADGASFASGHGNLTNPAARSFLIVNEVGEKEDAGIRGLAANDRTLFVANTTANEIRTYDAMTMQAGATWSAKRPGALALAPDGSLWAVLDIQSAKPQLQHYSATGTALADKVPLPDDAVPVSITFNAKGRLLVADNGPRQQIFTFTFGNGEWRADGTLGEPHGILAERAGVPGPQRFNGITSVATDAHGNVYVAMNGRGPRTIGADNGGVGDGAVLEGYGADGHRLFSLQGLLFVDGADIDRGDVSADGNTVSVFTGTWHFTLDLSKTAPGSEWSAAGFTADRFKYPDDALYHATRSERGIPLVRRLAGKRFVFYTDMFSEFIKIYRFDAARAGEVAIPSGLLSAISRDWPPGRPAKGGWIWRDTNGDGRLAANEFQALGAEEDSSCWYVDPRGDIWQGLGSRGIRRYRFNGLDHVGNPRYDFEHSSVQALPAPFSHVARIFYDPDTDVMYLSGASTAYPWDERDWNGMGKLFARYDHWSTKPTLRYQIPSSQWGPGAGPTQGIVQEGNYVFVVEQVGGVIRVYDADKGTPVGEIRPGPEVGASSGIADVQMPMTVYRRSNGEYLVFVEEDARGKVMLYRWTPGAPAPQK